MSERELSVAGVRTYLREAGRGEPLVLLHGLGASSYTWRRVLPALAQRHRVYAPDLPGMGRSAAPVEFDYSFAGFARWCGSLLDALGLERAFFAGNSLGGAVALFLALESPQRVGRLALLGAPVYPNNKPMLLWPMRWPLIGSLYERSLGPWAVAWIARSAFADPGLVTSDVVEEYSLSLRTPQGRSAIARFLRGAIPPDAARIVARYPSFDRPTLVVRGEHDRVVDLESARRFAVEIRRGRFLPIAGCGHAAQEERPEAVTAALCEFLGEDDGR